MAHRRVSGWLRLVGVVLGGAAGALWFTSTLERRFLVLDIGGRVLIFDLRNSKSRILAENIDEAIVGGVLQDAVRHVEAGDEYLLFMAICCFAVLGWLGCHLTLMAHQRIFSSGRD